jgi:Fe-S-cluster containining protein
MAQGLAIAPHDFIEKFCDLHPNRKMLVLKTKPDGACIFLEGQNHCQVQANKPGQCAGFPNRWRFDGWREWCEALEIPK